MLQSQKEIGDSGDMLYKQRHTMVAKPLMLPKEGSNQQFKVWDGFLSILHSDSDENVTLKAHCNLNFSLCQIAE
jgi:hypothetical protein